MFSLVFFLFLTFKYISITEETLAMTVHPEEYMGNLVDYCMLKINAVIKVKETKQSWSGEDDFVMDKPKLNIEVL